MADLYDRSERLTRVPNDLEALKAQIKGLISQ
jgi:threonine synthase